ncbi:class I adenylate-forming enzyme family protein [Sphingomonas sp. IC4-52]|uniref:class I adenylate-forming enzyme family protein n=1 Tax=Sphingomonas sp. IC4-52 TaxID=2887202 RepID=UPI001D1156C3|nr:class I adenylate-forming enzyme family protein [Sphingomonas sp. IC4-52]MCC2980272.1 acyl--CoA ligase [Sphingomonas sp. IC4-52]
MQVRRITDALRIRGVHQATEIAHDDTRRAITFAELDREVDEVAGGLAASGLRPGERVFLPISNHHAVEHMVAVFAVLRAGGIACPINTRFNAREVADYAALVEPRFAITDTPDILNNLPLDGQWTVDAMPRDAAALPDQASLDPAADAEILATSGTTGKIKGVVVSHADLVRGVTGTNMDRSRSTLHALPLTGSGGNLGIVMLPVRGGATAYTQPRFDAGEFLELTRRLRPDLVYLVPSMLRLLLDHPDAAKYDMAGVKYLMTGTAPLPHDSVMRTLQLWPHLRMRNSYGMSEGGVGIGTSTREQVLKPGCVGKLPAHMQLRDENGDVITTPHVVGEIYGYQPNPRRYWRDEEATAQAFAGGWTRSGDLGYIDDDGDLIMAGRSKELIIRGGYNITPLEIENVLHQHPAVQSAAVLGVPHDVLGEDIAAAIALRPGASVGAEDLQQYVRDNLADNKVPRTIRFFDELPLNPNGKVLKRELRAPLEEAAHERRQRRA